VFRLDADRFIAFDEAGEASRDVCVAEWERDSEGCAACADVDFGSGVSGWCAVPVDGDQDALIGRRSRWCQGS
jgi:hypothetical protein